MPSFRNGGDSRYSMRWVCSAWLVWVSLYLLVLEPILPIYGSGGVQFSCMLACFGVTLAGDSTFFRVGETMDFMMFTWSISLKVKVPNEWMRPASNDAHNEINDTKGVRIGWSRGVLVLSNDTQPSWSLHNEPNESLKLHTRYSWCLY